MLVYMLQLLARQYGEGPKSHLIKLSH